MEIYISNAGQSPIYAQFNSQIKEKILSGELKTGEALPSIRLLAKELRISVITTKRAYDDLEQEGFIMTVHGKGSFVTCSGQDIYLEERRREVEEELAAAVRKGRSCGMEQEELLELFQMVLEEP